MILVLLFCIYAALDGFDLGVGFWYPFARSERQRKTILSAIGPVWDGNEVWLLLSGGALFAAFPHAYATAFSGFYIPIMFVLFGLVFKAVALEFRNKVQSSGWRRMWDIAFVVGSILPAFLFGVAVGNIVRGIPLDANMNYAGSFLDLLNSYSLFAGIVGLTFFAMHGAAYIVLKTDGDLESKARMWVSRAAVAYGLMMIAFVIWTVIEQPLLLINFRAAPPLMFTPFIIMLSIVAVFWFNVGGKALYAFVASICSIVLFLATAAAVVFPYLIPAREGRGITIWDASSSALTLKTMLIIAGIGMPFVLAYTVWVYWQFRGKVDVG